MSSRALRLLFVCTANVCRSPLAAGLMAYNAKAAGAAVTVASGSIDHEVRSTHPMTVELLGERGVTLSRDQSQPLTPELVDGADLVLVMTAEHAKALVGRYPTARHKVFLLEHLATEVPPVESNEKPADWLRRVYALGRDYSRGDEWDIADPIAETESVYRAVDVQIDNATNWLATVMAGLG